MHIDQASQLRDLVRRSRCGQRRDARCARLVVVASSQPGVGATSVAVNLAALWNDGKQRALLVDADLAAAGATALCDMQPSRTLCDVLLGRYSLEDAISAGPGSLPVVCGLWGSELLVSQTVAAAQQLIEPLLALANFHVVLADVGHARSALARELWRAADLTLLVTTPDNPAVVNAYGAIKQQAASGCATPVRLLVNQAATDRLARDVAERLQASARRFLGADVALAGRIPFDPALKLAGRHRQLLAQTERDAPAPRALTHTRDALQAHWARAATDPSNEKPARERADNCPIYVHGKSRTESLNDEVLLGR
ncbi:MAG: hypothetical protein K1X71_11420 [Pirellulales bacterium]|nr:hypothetical protein [Pirellulales bacterium]